MPVFFVKAILIRNHILLILFYRRDSESFFELQDEFNTFFEWRGSMVYLTSIKHVSTPLYPEDSSPICYEFASSY